MIRRSLRLILAAVAAVAATSLLAGCWVQDEPSGATATTASSQVESVTVDGVTVTGALGSAPTVTLAEDFGPATELTVIDLVEGTGEPVAAGSTITVDYVGLGQQSRAVFDSSWGGDPATFSLDGVIPGWSQGLVGMKPGGRRLLIVPGNLGYGAGGNPAAGIAPDETLVFVVDLPPTNTP